MNSSPIGAPSSRKGSTFSKLPVSSISKAQVTPAAAERIAATMKVDFQATVPAPTFSALAIHSFMSSLQLPGCPAYCSLAPWLARDRLSSAHAPNWPPHAAATGTLVAESGVATIPTEPPAALPAALV